MSLSYDSGGVYEGIVPGGVYEVSLNDKYFIIKHHPYTDGSRLRLDRDKTECYIVEISNEDQFFDKRQCHGPFDEEQLAGKMREFGIDNVEVFYKKRR